LSTAPLWLSLMPTALQQVAYMRRVLLEAVVLEISRAAEAGAKAEKLELLLMSIHDRDGDVSRCVRVGVASTACYP
jgi:hypothetical protein